MSNSVIYTLGASSLKQYSDIERLRKAILVLASLVEPIGENVYDEYSYKVNDVIKQVKDILNCSDEEFKNL